MKKSDAAKTAPYVPRREAKIRDILGRTLAEILGRPWVGSVAEWSVAEQQIYDRAIAEFDEWLSKVFD